MSMLDEVKSYAEIARRAGILPRDLSEVAATAVILIGKEIGIPPFQALRSISFIGGRVVLSVQLQLALARKQANVELKVDSETDDAVTVTLKRASEGVTVSYTLADAKRAGLVRAGGTWEKFPRQMLRWRAIGDALRLIAPDVVMGLVDEEEAILISSNAGEHEAQIVEETESRQPESRQPESEQSESNQPEPESKKNGSKRAWQVVVDHAEKIGVDRDEVRQCWELARTRGLTAREFKESFVQLKNEADYITWSLQFEEIPAF